MVEVSSFRAYVREARRIEAINKAWEVGKTSKDFINMFRALLSLKLLDTPSEDLPTLVNTLMTRYGGILRPYQNQRELVRFIKRVEHHRPKVVLEIGTAKGGTLLLLARAAAKGATMISVDLPGGKFGGGYPSWKKPFFHRLVGPTKPLHLIRGNSHDESTFAQVSNVLGGRSVDVLLIDADHSYSGVKHDFLLYKQLVRPGGLICFHDIVQSPKESEIDVARFWNEVKIGYDVEEIIDPDGHQFFGIGIIVLPKPI